MSSASSSWSEKSKSESPLGHTNTMGDFGDEDMAKEEVSSSSTDIGVDEETN